MNKKSKPVAGTLHKEILLLKAEARMISTHPAVNLVQLVFSDERRSLVVHQWEFDTAAEARAHYAHLPV